MKKPKKIKSQTYVVEYSSNNSGGYWWLEDDDWKALEKAGWSVQWYADSEFHKKYSTDGRSLGALAAEATVEVDAPDEAHAIGIAVDHFEKITGANADDEGCSCCGPPHYFYAKVRGNAA